jgi:hypothetical protein
MQARSFDSNFIWYRSQIEMKCLKKEAHFLYNLIFLIQIIFALFFAYFYEILANAFHRIGKKSYLSSSIYLRLASIIFV